MKKLIKFLGFVGLTSAILYLTYGLKAESSTDKNTKGFDGDNSNSGNKNKSNNNQTKATSTTAKHVTDYSDSRTQKMYKDLGMTNEQKRQYENDYRAVMGRWEKENDVLKMSEQEKIDEHNSVLNAVLNEAQYSMYRDWFMDNPA